MRGVGVLTDTIRTSELHHNPSIRRAGHLKGRKENLHWLTIVQLDVLYVTGCSVHHKHKHENRLTERRIGEVRWKLELKTMKRYSDSVAYVLQASLMPAGATLLWREGYEDPCTCTHVCMYCPPSRSMIYYRTDSKVCARARRQRIAIASWSTKLLVKSRPSPSPPPPQYHSTNVPGPRIHRTRSQRWNGMFVLVDTYVPQSYNAYTGLKMGTKRNEKENQD